VRNRARHRRATPAISPRERVAGSFRGARGVFLPHRGIIKELRTKCSRFMSQRNTPPPPLRIADRGERATGQPGSRLGRIAHGGSRVVAFVSRDRFYQFRCSLLVSLQLHEIPRVRWYSRRSFGAGWTRASTRSLETRIRTRGK